MTATTPMSDPTSIVGRRIGAWVIDLVIFLILVFLASGLASGGSSKIHTVHDAPAGYCTTFRAEHRNSFCFISGTDATTFVGNGAGNAVWLIHLVVYIVIQGVAGGSIGKLIVGLRVVDAQGKQAGIGRSAARTVLWVVDAVTCGLPVIGGILILVTNGHRRVGDMVAGTYVVPKDQVGRPPMALPPTPGYPATWPGAPGPSGAAWTPPGPQPGAPMAPTAPAAPPADGPTWDAARNAYIQYDQARGAWLQFDNDAQEWKPISQ